MAHYAKVVDGIVSQVIVAEQEFIDTLPDKTSWIKTSYNTRHGIYYEPNSNTVAQDQSKALRGNYAGVGYIYDSTYDVFYEPKPHSSWTLNTTTWTWDSPIPYPKDGNHYLWSEYSQNWIKVESDK